MMKVRQEELEGESTSLRNLINDKEATLKDKEGYKARVKQTIEIENANRENEIHALRV